MNCGLIIRTVKYLKAKQIFYQIYYRCIHTHYKALIAPCHRPISLPVTWIEKPVCFKNGEFHFLNLSHVFSDWNFQKYGMLWAYNLNYFDFLHQTDFSKDDACYWIDKFSHDIKENHVGLDPYPIALRGINWIKFFCKYPECATKVRENTLWSQYTLLKKKLEYHLLGNHLLEDCISLLIAALYFDHEKWLKKSTRLLLNELEEQMLGDGAHYEQSPMYHSILLDRLLDAINFALGRNKQALVESLKHYACRQLGWLQAICYKDGSWPFFNDASLNIAPPSEKIFNYARQLNIEADKSKLSESGYRIICSERQEVRIDCGNITATYQPGHTHADSLTYELRIDGKPFVVDTGISTYNKNERRQYERSTIAHNCVIPDSNMNNNSSEVWGGFRVGKRCRTTIIKDEPHEIIAEHNGFVQPCRRRWCMHRGGLLIEDTYAGNAISIIHLTADADIKRIHIEGAKKIEFSNNLYSIEYNRFIPCKVLYIYFENRVNYFIS